jgi:Raf kinase inhibitor-like YbhB/YbcL family protein
LKLFWNIIEEMNRLIIVLLACVTAVSAFISTFVYYHRPQVRKIPSGLTDSHAFNITSPVFSPGGTIPKMYTCDGSNISPPLQISHVPAKTRSFVLIVDDIDTPQGTFVHWLVWNIAADTQVIAQNSVPPGSYIGRNGFGTTGYGGPCPPNGQHRYVFRLYALDTEVVIAAGAQKQQVIDAMNTHVITETEYTGVYQR